ncbi:MAG: hypothetical protein LKI93_01700 [Bifidobacteriaceae bacterium]|nr:hypothetical protein [Bifidobacteriaceae bacterium]MCI1915288.1 hypothetical protein [Bifidobacteriaceae bacterium]
MWLANLCCQLAFKATDVARGRLDPKVLMKEMGAQLIEQILNLDVILEIHHQHVNRQTLLFAAKFPIQICGLQAVVIHRNCFDACVSMKIGAEFHCANVVLSLVGSHWKCTTFQLA